MRDAPVTFSPAKLASIRRFMDRLFAEGDDVIDINAIDPECPYGAGQEPDQQTED